MFDEFDKDIKMIKDNDLKIKIIKKRNKMEAWLVNINIKIKFNFSVNKKTKY